MGGLYSFNMKTLFLSMVLLSVHYGAQQVAEGSTVKPVKALRAVKPEEPPVLDFHSLNNYPTENGSLPLPTVPTQKPTVTTAKVTAAKNKKDKGKGGKGGRGAVGVKQKIPRRSVLDFNDRVPTTEPVKGQKVKGHKSKGKGRVASGANIPTLDFHSVGGDEEKKTD